MDGCADQVLAAHARVHAITSRIEAAARHLATHPRISDDRKTKLQLVSPALTHTHRANDTHANRAAKWRITRLFVEHASRTIELVLTGNDEDMADKVYQEDVNERLDDLVQDIKVTNNEISQWIEHFFRNPTRTTLMPDDPAFKSKRAIDRALNALVAFHRTHLQDHVISDTNADSVGAALESILPSSHRFFCVRCRQQAVSVLQVYAHALNRLVASAYHDTTFKTQRVQVLRHARQVGTVLFTSWHEWATRRNVAASLQGTKEDVVERWRP